MDTSKATSCRDMFLEMGRYEMTDCYIGKGVVTRGDCNAMFSRVGEKKMERFYFAGKIDLGSINDGYQMFFYMGYYNLKEVSIKNWVHPAGVVVDEYRFK